MHGTDVESVRAELAAEGGAEKRAYVRTVFEEIAPRYDLLNHLLSLNIDTLWRRRALRTLEWTRRPNGRFARAVRRITTLTRGVCRSTLSFFATGSTRVTAPRAISPRPASVSLAKT